MDDTLFGKRLTRFLVWGLPSLVLAMQLAAESLVPANTMAQMMSESGPVEAAQFVIITGAFLIAVSALRQASPARHRFLFFWLLLAALSCLYVAGEEISWGQHILNWDTPEYWTAVNDQHETNFHNTTSWLDQKPRLILFLGIITGGIVIPLLARFRPSLLPAMFAPVYPPAVLMPVALFVLFPYLAQELVEHFMDRGIFQRVSEVQELYMFYFVLLYLIVLRRRVLA